MTPPASAVTAPPVTGLPPVLQHPGQSNGTPRPETPARPTKPQRAKSLKGRLFLLGGILALATCGIAGYALTAGPKARRPDLILYKVHYEPLNLTVVERGALE